MKQAILRWAFYLAALLVVGPLAGLLTAWLRAPDGGHAATPLLSSFPLAGLLSGLLAVGIALAFGAAAARLLGTGPALSVAGLTLAWPAWRTGTIDDLLRTAHWAGAGAGPAMIRLGVEGAIFGIAGIALAAVLVLAGRRHDPDLPGAPGREGRVLPDAAGLPALAVAVIAAGAGVWLLAQQPLKGQCIAATIFGGFLAAAAGKLVNFRAPAPTFVAALAVLAVVGPLAGIAFGSPSLVRAANANTLMPLAYPLPLDWIAGALLGVPLGLAWAHGSIAKRAGIAPRA